MMTNYIQLTHYSTGDTSFVNVDAIVTVSQGFDRVLVITTAGQGSYYRESAEYIMECIEANIINRVRLDPQVCDLGPVPVDVKDVPLYQVVAKWDTNFNNDVEVCTYENRLDAIGCFKACIDEFQNGISDSLDLEDCDFSGRDADLPEVYLVDRSGEDTLKLTVKEVYAQ